ncbi:respiratory nitrate reductase subunit gamma [Propionibacterium sp. NM47_B9-13]|jgi:nitrate reductase gamma subunit|uniref:Nitrate reductase-like protein NarX n=2 Tax=Cutibacterium modestum TaxID=2559073 RepID=A0AAD1NUX0_9ACTN|nr:respiratory nitrate reductase subunit gamma [Cutibacterium modestum]TGY28865.1 respiratory nitrate reductase subunit gamma [Propionibacterium sp. NM47_B9-13]AOH45181.1 respiratory nitrate reductase subunit gamma [Cutibacterium modestum]EFS73129.1 respiratory nitrate reductase, gamma subunit [Cutibacterium modestum HL037PA2]EFS93104.1 respiratory nitrate reductase, gamma subunit [Cutibacterium modestum HL044PA1]EFT16503.1 respiratory nitrate reductase, gamma subunit [Cutibacterium modestum H
MNTKSLLVWLVLPYLSIVLFIGGMIWRYRTDQFGWTSRSSQWNEPAILRWSSPLFHFGILFVFLGHVLGLVFPAPWICAIGITEDAYHVMATVLGGAAGLAALIGLFGLLYRRFVMKSVRLTTTRMDIVTYVLLTLAVALGCWATVHQQMIVGGYDYRNTISPWFRSIALFQPRPALMAAVPLDYKMHVLAGLILLSVWPFTRLVHAISAPVSYPTRPYVVYRSRNQHLEPSSQRYEW